MRFDPLGAGVLLVIASLLVALAWPQPKPPAPAQHTWVLIGDVSSGVCLSKEIPRWPCVCDRDGKHCRIEKP